jgi:glycosyltransferase involved in cell wall biosynthesis
MPGRSGKLREALASVVAQTYQFIELVVVEDGGQSADSLLEALRQTGRFTDLTYIPMAKGGRCTAGNAALAAATGQLLCFLDDDDLFYADHLEVLVNAWLNQPDLGAVYALAYEVRTEVISEEPWVYRDVEHSLIHRQVFNRAVLWHHNYLPIQTVLFQRQLFLDHGGFDPGLDSLEDWNLWVRYSLHHDFLLVPKVTSLYRVPDNNAKAVKRQEVLDGYYAQAQARHALLRREMSPPEVLQMAEEMARQMYVVAVPASSLRKLFFKVPLLKRLYHPLKKGITLLRRMRA